MKKEKKEKTAQRLKIGQVKENNKENRRDETNEKT